MVLRAQLPRHDLCCNGLDRAWHYRDDEGEGNTHNGHPYEDRHGYNGDMLSARLVMDWLLLFQ